MKIRYPSHQIWRLSALQIFMLILLNVMPYVQSQLTSEPMLELERLQLKDEARDMFYHAYDAYMANAYPADELMPLSCKGRYRDPMSSRGDIDEVLGNFSLTLVDTLDSLVVFGDLPEFEKSVKLIIRDVNFDTDVIVSVFETNIRMLGGLLSGHVLAVHLNELHSIMPWYKTELLDLAQDLATRLLPAFNTTTGIPHSRVNLRHGMDSPKLRLSRDTCTSCAGTMILEFASLSRLTGHSVFEDKARKAMDSLWEQRHQATDLVGTVVNVHNGDWVRRDSGIGAGIDSYYEYLLKAYVLLGDPNYLLRFNTHYAAVMKYISQGPMYLEVHMHRPETVTRNFMDALLAFWPGLQVLKGDIKPAIETHEMLYQVVQRHKFLPEAFTTDFQIHWGQYLLRPEFVESTYLLYEATGDHYYLRVGRELLKSLQKHAWVPCGYAAVKDVRTGAHEDRMDSFVLSETFKYLYLLFSKAAELPIDVSDFVFTTEAHLLPLSLARMTYNVTMTSKVPLADVENSGRGDEFFRSCPNVQSSHNQQFAEKIRKPLKNYVSSMCPNKRGSLFQNRKLRGADFQTNNRDHHDLLSDMGIKISTTVDGKLHLIHLASKAKSPIDADEGLLFMQEVSELSKIINDTPETSPKAVIYAVEESRCVAASINHKDSTPPKECKLGEELTRTLAIETLRAGPAQFGLQLKDGIVVDGSLVIAEPYRACGSLTNAADVKGKIVLVERGDCLFIDKARVLQNLGAIGGIVVDNGPNLPEASDIGGDQDTPPMFAMSGDDSKDDVSIPMVFLFSATALIESHQKMVKSGGISVMLSEYPKESSSSDLKSLYLDSKEKFSIGQRAQSILEEKINGDVLVSALRKEVENEEAKEELSLDSPDSPRFSIMEIDLMRVSSSIELIEMLKKHTVSFHQNRDGKWRAKRIKFLVTKIAEYDNDILHTLLSNHVHEFISVLDTVMKTEERKAETIDEVVHSLVEVLVRLSAKEKKAPRTSSSPSTPPTGGVIPPTPVRGMDATEVSNGSTSPKDEL